MTAVLASRAETSRWPEAESFAAQNVLQPPSADDALAYFHQLENRTAT